MGMHECVDSPWAQAISRPRGAVPVRGLLLEGSVMQGPGGGSSAGQIGFNAGGRDQHYLAQGCRDLAKLTGHLGTALWQLTVLAPCLQHMPTKHVTGGQRTQQHVLSMQRSTSSSTKALKQAQAARRWPVLMMNSITAMRRAPGA